MYKQRSLSRSRTAYYLRKTGENDFYDVGSASRNTKDVFLERIAAYIADDPALAESILQSNSRNRSQIILMLGTYLPQQN